MLRRDRCSRREPTWRDVKGRLRVCLFGLFAWFLTAQCALAGDGQSTIDENVLRYRLNNLESHSVQRRGRAPTIVDLLNDQRDKRAGQALNRLKTKDIRNKRIPLFEGKLRRSRRPAGRIGR